MADDRDLELLKADLAARITAYTCGHKCMGHPGNTGACCKVADRDWIIGPISEPDIADFLKDAAAHGLILTRQQFVIDFEEGRAMFPERSTWQNPTNYPALRIIKDGKLNACQFYKNGCSIQEFKSALCRSYRCDWLKKALEAI